MRVALFIVEPPAMGEPATIAGRSLVLRQFDFARGLGVERVLACGDGLAPEVIALRHEAEGAGLRFQHVALARGLLGAVGTADEVLVLAPGVLTEQAAAADLLAKGPCVISLPASLGVPAGFERIDPQRAWAGALVLPGGLVERLADLPPEVDLASALLRIALQGRVPDRPLLPGLLDSGGWVLALPERLPAIETAWLERHAGAAAQAGAGPLTRRIVRSLLRRSGLRMLREPRALPASLGGGILLGIVALGLAWQGNSAAGLACAGLAGLPFALRTALARLRGAAVRADPLAPALPWLADGVLLGTLALSLPGTAIERLFAPLVLLAALRLSQPQDWPRWAAWLPDRLSAALLLGLAALAGQFAPALMVLAAGLLVAELARRKGDGG